MDAPTQPGVAALLMPSHVRETMALVLRWLDRLAADDGLDRDPLLTASRGELRRELDMDARLREPFVATERA